MTIQAELHYRHNGTVPTFASGTLSTDHATSSYNQPVFVVDWTARHSDPFPKETIITPASLKLAGEVVQNPVLVVLYPWIEGSVDFAQSSGFVVEIAAY